MMHIRDLAERLQLRVLNCDSLFQVQNYILVSPPTACGSTYDKSWFEQIGEMNLLEKVLNPKTPQVITKLTTESANPQISEFLFDFKEPILIQNNTVLLPIEAARYNSNQKGYFHLRRDSKPQATLYEPKVITSYN